MNRTRTSRPLGPKDPATKAILEFVLALYRDGLPTSRGYVSRRLAEAGITADADTITRACGWAPYVPERRQSTP